jgi:hypothetical protein
MTLRSISHLRAKAFYRVRSVTSVHLSNHHCCCALPSFSTYHPLSWTTVPFLHTSIYNDLGDDGRRWCRASRSSRCHKKRPFRVTGRQGLGQRRLFLLIVSASPMGQTIKDVATYRLRLGTSFAVPAAGACGSRAQHLPDRRKRWPCFPDSDRFLSRSTRIIDCHCQHV